jgi:hypothetical protein
MPAKKKSSRKKTKPSSKKSSRKRSKSSRTTTTDYVPLTPRRHRHKSLRKPRYATDAEVRTLRKYPYKDLRTINKLIGGVNPGELSKKDTVWSICQNPKYKKFCKLSKTKGMLGLVAILASLLGVKKAYNYRSSKPDQDATKLDSSKDTEIEKLDTIKSGGLDTSTTSKLLSRSELMNATKLNVGDYWIQQTTKNKKEQRTVQSVTNGLYTILITSRGKTYPATLEKIQEQCKLCHDDKELSSEEFERRKELFIGNWWTGENGYKYEIKNKKKNTRSEKYIYTYSINDLVQSDNKTKQFLQNTFTLR